MAVRIFQFGVVFAIVVLAPVESRKYKTLLLKKTSLYLRASNVSNMAGFTWLAILPKILLLKFQVYVDVFDFRTIVSFSTVREGHVICFTSIFLRFAEAVTLKTCCYYEPHKHKVVHSLFL